MIGVNQVVNTTVNTTHLVPVTEEESHFCWNWSFSCTKKVTRYVTQWRTEKVQAKTYRVFFFNWYPPKKLKYGKPRLGESTLT